MAHEYLPSSPSRNTIDPMIYQNSPSALTSAKKTGKSKRQGPQTLPQPLPPQFPQTGFTPVVNKTYFQDMSFNLTPNKDGGAVDYAQGLNLTPFLTHNMNIPMSATSNTINHQFATMTPFQEKTLHLADFFMDSPLNHTPTKDAETITPSKFAVKRSIGQVDTPPRQPHKLSITYKAGPEKTPCKTKLADITNKTPVRPGPDSSPSTVIMSSAARADEETNEEEDEENQPPSPTPLKETKPVTDKAPPMMGVFSERKPKEKKKKRAAPTNTKFQIVFTDVHTLMNNKTKKKEPKKKLGPAMGQWGNAPSQGTSSQTYQIPPQNPNPPQHPSQQPPNQHPNQHPGQHPSQHPSHPSHLQPLPQSQPAPRGHPRPADVTINSSKELSMMSHPNQTTEHTSFEMAGVSSTPNGKFILDKVFERPSPNGYVGYGQMPPPNAKMGPQQYQQQQLMMMSTPQHQSVMNYVNSLYSEVSPLQEGALPVFASPTHYPILNLSASMVQQNQQPPQNPYNEEM
ncbi:hypothetical protein DICA3_D17392 [Diutina catenulata]